MYFTSITSMLENETVCSSSQGLKPYGSGNDLFFFFFFFFFNFNMARKISSKELN